MSDAANVELLVAALDLNLVRLLRSAMNGGRPPGGIGPAPSHANSAGPAAIYEPRRHLHPEPVIEPRRHIHPTPRFEPRPVIHPTPRVEPTPVDCSCPAESAPCPPPRKPTPLPPPWISKPWQTPLPPRPMVKRVVHRTDVVNKGSLLDFFL